MYRRAVGIMAVIVVLGIAGVVGEKYLTKPPQMQWSQGSTTASNNTGVVGPIGQTLTNVSGSDQSGQQQPGTTAPTPIFTGALAGTTNDTSGTGGVTAPDGSTTGITGGTTGTTDGTGSNSTSSGSAPSTLQVSGQVTNWSVSTEKYNGSYGVLKVDFEVTNWSGQQIQFVKNGINNQPTLWLVVNGKTMFMYNDQQRAMYQLQDSADMPIPSGGTKATFTIYFLTNMTPDSLKTATKTLHVGFGGTQVALDLPLK